MRALVVVLTVAACGGGGRDPVATADGPGQVPVDDGGTPLTLRGRQRQLAENAYLAAPIEM